MPDYMFYTLVGIGALVFVIGCIWLAEKWENYYYCRCGNSKFNINNRCTRCGKRERDYFG
jgi:hypothetical protein